MRSISVGVCVRAEYVGVDATVCYAGRHVVKANAVCVECMLVCASMCVSVMLECILVCFFECVLCVCYRNASVCVCSSVYASAVLVRMLRMRNNATHAV